MKKFALVALAAAVTLIGSIDEASAARRRGGCCRQSNPCRVRRDRCCTPTTHDAMPAEGTPTPAPIPEEAAPAPAAA